VRIEWTAAARRDRQSIYSFIENFRPQAAIDMDELVERRANDLVSNPNSGRPGWRRGTRARRDLTGIYDFIELDNARAARDMIAQLEQAAERLVAFP
jgi:plasmid stabilization system protein ParE